VLKGEGGVGTALLVATWQTVASARMAGFVRCLHTV
jgi:hypothetical protein